MRELAALFLRLGSTAFGGPAAHIAVMESEVVRRRRWLTPEEFLDMMGAANLIPGPNSTEMAIHIGYRRAGLAGVLVAGSAFILPAALLTLGLAWAYVRFGALPQMTAFFYGAKPAIITVVAQALWRLGRAAVRSRFLAAAALVALTAAAAGIDELVVLFATPALVAGVQLGSRARTREEKTRKMGATAGALSLGASGAGVVTAAAPFTMAGLFLFFLKVGSVLFGSGYVLLAFLRADLVERWHWLTSSQLLDAVTAGQLTPGPVFTTATFIGYVLGGVKGALLATIGIFLPAFFFVAVSAPLVPRLRASQSAAALLDGLNVASLALLAFVTWQLLRSAIVDFPTALIATASALLLFAVRLNPAWIVIGAGVVGIVFG
ncbi:MAG TPA: chromate efflux transporter [Myxococcota bacterium]|nr:chromate efflux transporter [Myxococcota bacterium]